MTLRLYYDVSLSTSWNASVQYTKSKEVFVHTYIFADKGTQKANQKLPVTKYSNFVTIFSPFRSSLETTISRSDGAKYLQYS